MNRTEVEGRAQARRILALNNSLFVVILRCLALASSMTCIKILSSRKLKGSLVYKYLLCVSVCDFLYTALMLLLRIFTGLCSEMDSSQCGIHAFYTLLVL
jgi:hypothetical protein